MAGLLAAAVPAKAPGSVKIWALLLGSPRVLPASALRLPALALPFACFFFSLLRGKRKPLSHQYWSLPTPLRSGLRY